MRNIVIELAPPPYTDLDAANEEINRLRGQLAMANQKYANLFLKGELDRRALKGEIAQLKKKLEGKLDLEAF